MTQLLLKKGSSGLLLTGSYLAAMVVFFIGERLVLESIGLRIILAAVALVGIAFAIVGRLIRAKSIGQKTQARAVEQMILGFYLVGFGALIIYFAQADFVMEKLRAGFDAPKAADKYEVVLATLWPVVWFCSILPLIFVEISYAPMNMESTVDLGRILRSRRSGLIVAMSICLMFVLNFIFSEFNKKIDLSYFKTTRPSESSKKMVENLSQPMKAVLFFPGANEVRELAASYFEELGKSSNKFIVQIVDHAMEPILAKELSVSDNGTVALASGSQKETITLGSKLDGSSKNKLKKLDQEFQTAFLKITRGQKTAYFTVGHEERGSSVRDRKPGSSIRDLRTVLQKLNYELKDLGLGQGLAQEVPNDATVVFIVGPTKPFLPSEIDALKRYLKGGGSMFVFLDPEAELDYADLLGPLGLKFNPVRVANDHFHARATFTPADVY
ncbi:MAG: Gldg family protein, partial [Pseudomonadota bacterium]